MYDSAIALWYCQLIWYLISINITECWLACVWDLLEFSFFSLFMIRPRMGVRQKNAASRQLNGFFRGDRCRWRRQGCRRSTEISSQCSILNPYHFMLRNVMRAKTSVGCRCNRASEHEAIALSWEYTATVDTFFRWRNSFLHCTKWCNQEVWSD